jgi:ADP-ribose pyrophosphatase YjhB (NUDIX family)
MKYCSQCGAPVQLQVPAGDDRPRFVCDHCGQVHYENPRMVVGCIPEWGDRILLCRRNIEPQKDLWTLPAGYLENGESVVQGAQRETLEESRAVVEALEPYMLIDIIYIHQVYMMFRAKIKTPQFGPTPESAEVRLFREDQIPWDQIAFLAIAKTLKYYFKDRAAGSFPFRMRPIEKRISPAY